MALIALDLGSVRGNEAVIPDGSVVIFKGGKPYALTPGTNGQQLEADSTADGGVKWDSAT